jgi:uncharacterized protein with HEPN domain
MPPDDSVYLGHMLDLASKAAQKVAGLSKDAYEEDENLRLALAHPVQMIGEAARRVSAKTRGAHPEVPWADIVGMRSKIVHDYMNVDEDIVWEVATRDLPTLVEALERLQPDD